MAFSERRTRIIVQLVLPGVVFLTVLLLALAYVRPAAPRALTFFAGPSGGNADQYARAYATYLKSHGIEVRIVETEGALESLERLASSTTTAVSLVESAVTADRRLSVDVSDLVSLGSMYLTPVWLFAPNGVEFADLEGFEGKRILVGAAGSSGRAITELMLHVQGLNPDQAPVTFGEWTSAQFVIEQLSGGNYDVAFLLGGRKAPVVEQLLASSVLQPVSLERAEAYRVHFPSVLPIRIPRGAVDLARDVPERDVQLAAAVTSLLAKKDIHPAATELLLDAAAVVHAKPEFPTAFSFPSSDYATLPLSDEARRYFRDGPSVIRQYLPYALATLVTQILTVLIPVATVGYAVFKIVPALVKLRFTLRLERLYRRLKALEASSAPTREAFEQLLNDSLSLTVPLDRQINYFDFRQHANDICERTLARAGNSNVGAASAGGASAGARQSGVPQPRMLSLLRADRPAPPFHRTSLAFHPPRSPRRSSSKRSIALGMK